jgi:hypothetical protein
MNGVLIFLIIFAAAGIIAKLGHATLFSRFLIAPSFVTMGMLLSQSGLGILRPSTLLDLDLFTQVAISWLAFLLGLRGRVYAHRAYTDLGRKLFHLGINLLFTYLLVLLAFWGGGQSPIFKLGTGIYLTASLFSASLLMGRKPIFSSGIRINSFYAAIVAMIFMAPFLFFIYQEQFANLYQALMPFWSGVLCACFCLLTLWLILKVRDLSQEVLILCLIALCATMAGIAKWFFIPHVVPGFLFGLLSSHFMGLAKPQKTLFLSEQPVKIMLMILIGAHLTISFKTIAAGIGFGLIIYFVRFFGRFFMKRLFDRSGVVFAFMGASEVPVLFAASIFFVLPEPHLVLNDLLLFIFVVASVGDVLGIARWSMVLRRRRQKVHAHRGLEP